MAASHRKRVKHFDEPGQVHELTFSCCQRMQLLTNDSWRKMLADSIDRAIERHRYRLLAFVFMPEHVHLLVFPERNAGTVSELLKAVKRPFSYRIKQLLIETNSPLLQKLTIRQRPEVTTFRFWQEGPGYDRNITDAATLQKCLDHIHTNPVARGLCARAIDWHWSSDRYHLLPGLKQHPGLPKLSPIPVDLLS